MTPASSEKPDCVCEGCGHKARISSVKLSARTSRFRAKCPNCNVKRAFQVGGAAHRSSVVVPSSQRPSLLQALIDEALANNNALAARRQQIKALKTESPAAGMFDDPKVGIGIISLPVDSFDLNQEPMTQKQISISQKLPWFGRLKLMEKAILLKAAQEEQLLRERELELARQIAAQ